MELQLERKILADDYTEGCLYVDGIYFCDTLEDKFRMNGEKTPGETSIPAGKYEVKMTLSNRFKKVMPEILNVSGFTGIRIHPGNTAKDTDGCILVGEKCGDGLINQSKATYDRLITCMDYAIKEKGEAIQIIVK